MTRTAGTYKVVFTTFHRPNSETFINLYASSPASARQIVAKRFGLTDADTITVTLIERISN